MIRDRDLETFKLMQRKEERKKEVQIERDRQTGRKRGKATFRG